MADCIVPELATNLFLGDTGTSHLHNGIPGIFNEAIGRLVAGICYNNLGVVGSDPLKRLPADEFVVEVEVVLLQDGTGVCAVGFKSSIYIGRGE